MVSKNNFDRLQSLVKTKTENYEQVYEDVNGFDSLSLDLQTKTLSFSCSNDEKDYEENLLMSRPLPWVVRVFFKSKNSFKGALCSGKQYIYIW